MARGKTPGAAPAPKTELERRIVAGDLEGVVALLGNLPAAERRAHRATAVALDAAMDAARWSSVTGKDAAWDGPVTQAQQVAGAAAILLCGDARDLAKAWDDDPRLLDIAERFRPASLDGVADALLQIHANRIETVETLIARGLIARPDNDLYKLGLMALAQRHARLPVEQRCLDDPGLPRALLGMFDVEGTPDVSLASIDKYNFDPQATWPNILLRLVARGALTRAELLERTIGALERDWIQHRSGWFSRFHDTLAPTPDEMAPFAARYVGLVGSRIPPTVTLALKCVAALHAEGRLRDGEVVAAMAAPLASAVKGQVDDALRILQRAVERDPSQARPAAAAAATALAHKAADVQRRALDVIARWGVDASLRPTLVSMQGLVAASNRAALQRLLGAEHGVPADPARAAPTAAPRGKGVISPLTEDAALAPVAGLAELVELIAYVFENDTDIDAFERAVAALVRGAPFDAGAIAQFTPVLKRLDRLRTPVAQELGRLVRAVTTGDHAPARIAIDSGGNESPVHALLAARIDALVELARAGCGVAPLSSPTHANGFIAPAVLLERVARCQQHAVAVPPLEQVQAILRLAPGDAQALARRAMQLQDTPLVRALRYAWGDDAAADVDTELLVAAARARAPGRDDPIALARAGDLGPDGPRAASYSWHVKSWTSEYGGTVYPHHDLYVETAPVPAGTPMTRLSVWRHDRGPKARRHYRVWTFAGTDEALVHYAATVVPGDLEAFFAEGARVFGANLDWSEAQWHNRAYLAPLLAGTTSINTMATLFLAVALAGKEPGQTALAVDALVTTWRDGRLDTKALGAVLRALLETPLPKPPRYAKSLQAALAIEPALAQDVFELIGTMLCAEAPAAPHDLAPLMALALEIASDRAVRPAAATIAALKRLPLGKGKAGALAQRLAALSQGR